MFQLWLAAFFDWYQPQITKGCVEVEIPESFWQQLKDTYAALQSDLQTRQRTAHDLNKSVSHHCSGSLMNGDALFHQLSNAGVCSWKLQNFN